MSVINIKFHGSNAGIQNEIRNIWTNGDLFDTALVSADGKKFPVHRLVLCIQSEVFNRLYTDKSGPETSTVFLRGVRSDQLQSLLEVIYQGETDIPESELKSFLQLAEELQIKCLRNEMTGNNSRRESIEQPQSVAMSSESPDRSRVPSTNSESREPPPPTSVSSESIDAAPVSSTPLPASRRKRRCVTARSDRAMTNKWPRTPSRRTVGRLGARTRKETADTVSISGEIGGGEDEMSRKSFELVNKEMERIFGSQTEQDCTSDVEADASSPEKGASSQDRERSQDKAPSTQDRAASAQDRTPSAQDRAASAQDRAPSSPDRAASAQDRAPSSPDRAVSSQDRPTGSNTVIYMENFLKLKTEAESGDISTILEEISTCPVIETQEEFAEFLAKVDKLVAKNLIHPVFRMFDCIVCGAQMKTKQHVRNHIEVHHVKGVKHRCPTCGQCCKTRASLDCHTAKQHRGRKDKSTNQLQTSIN